MEHQQQVSECSGLKLGVTSGWIGITTLITRIHKPGELYRLQARLCQEVSGVKTKQSECSAIAASNGSSRKEYEHICSL